MHPYLFSFDLPFRDEPFHLRAFGVMVALGFLVGAHLYQRIAGRYGDDPEEDPMRYSRITLWILIGAFVGARVMYVVVEILRDSETGKEYLANPIKMLFVWEGGLVFYGGLIGACLLGTWSARREKVRPLHALDLGLVVGFVGQAIGRVGCLLVGDDYGSVVPERLGHPPFPIALRVPDPLPPGSLFGQENAGQVLWATQVWMSLNALLVAFLAWRILRRRRYTGQVTLWVVVIYAATRSLIEAFRGDSLRGMWFGGAISTSQLVSLAGGLAALTLLFLLRGRREERPPHWPA
jgi:phosphatidylglycerol:prolipoprotein diacylglycerol transferase